MCLIFFLMGQFLQGIDPAVMPLGIITLEDVLEGNATYSIQYL